MHSSGRFQKLESALLTPIHEALANSAIDTEDEVQGIRAELRDLDELGDPRGIEAAKSGARLYVLKVVHVIRSSGRIDHGTRGGNRRNGWSGRYFGAARAFFKGEGARLSLLDGLVRCPLAIPSGRLPESANGQSLRVPPPTPPCRGRELRDAGVPGTGLAVRSQKAQASNRITSESDIDGCGGPQPPLLYLEARVGWRHYVCHVAKLWRWVRLLSP